MLKAKVLPKVLEQAAGDGVDRVVLVNNEGSLLASSHPNSASHDLLADSDSSAPPSDRIIAGLASNLWLSSNGNVNPDIGMLTLKMDNHQGHLTVFPVTSNVVLCAYTKVQLPLGRLRLRLSALAKHLHDPLEEVLGS